MTDYLFILLAIGCVFLNAFFVAAEFAMVKLRYSRLPQLKSQGLRGRILYRVHQHLDTYLSACQLGITLASLGLGWLGEPTLARFLVPFLNKIGVFSPQLVTAISFFLAFSMISFLHIVVGELMPKSMAIRQSEKISLWTAVPLYVFYWTMYPFISLLNGSANKLLKWFHLDKVHAGEAKYSAEEIKFILKASHQHDGTSHSNHEMILRMLDFSRLQAVDVMRPLDEMVSISQKSNLQEKLKFIQEHRYTRYPVYQKANSHIVGLLHAKDILLAVQSGSEQMIPLREIVKVQREVKAMEVLERFRQGMPHFALVYQYKKLIGFITLDDLLHELIGHLKDEFHLTTEDWTVLPEGGFLLKGNAPVYVVEKLMEVDLSAYPVDTISGLMLHVLERFPVVGDIWEQPNYTLKVKKIEGHRIAQLILTPIKS